MAKKKKRKSPEPWTCPKCGETFGTKGRHAAACKGKLVTDGSLDIPVVRRTRGSRGRGAGTITAGALANLNGYRERVESFRTASEDMVTMFLGVIGELEVVKRERDDLAQFKQGLSALLAKPGPGTPVS